MTAGTLGMLDSQLLPLLECNAAHQPAKYQL